MRDPANIAKSKLAVYGVLADVLTCACGTADESKTAPTDKSDTDIAKEGFTDVTDEVGLTFIHDAGVDGGYFMSEIIGSGVALFDHDSDRDLDIYLVNSGAHGETAGDGANRLFSQKADGHFVDRTMESGLGDAGYGMGTALGDIDNDGGRFANITETAGVAGNDGSTSSCFLDYDLEGLLDLYVTGYVDDRPAKSCTDSAGRREYCGSNTYRGVPDKLWRNDGDGRFSDTGASTGIARGAGKGLGGVSADFNGAWPWRESSRFFYLFQLFIE